MAYSEDFRRRAINYKNEGHIFEQTCQVFKIAPSTLNAWI